MSDTKRVETTYLEFKDSRVEEQWVNEGGPEPLNTTCLHPALRVVVAAAAHWHYRATGRPAVLTHLLRRPEEQRAMYPDKPDLRSTHEFGRAADLRTQGLEAHTARAWEEWINGAFAYLGRADSRTALLHEVGGRGLHLHLQVGPAEPYPGRQAGKSQTETRGGEGK